jgi:DNA modification methylase
LKDRTLKAYYEERGIQIYHGDCRDILPFVKADCLVSDPPYGIAHPTDYKARGRGNLTSCTDYPPVHGDDADFDPRWLFRDYLHKPMVLWGANYYASRLMDCSGWLVWDKERPDTLDQATCELAWTNCVKGVRRFRYLWNGMMRDGNEALVHPTQKPIALMKWVLNLKWVAGETVVDPYMGAGSTLRAAKDLGRNAIGIEIEERYCEIAANRLRQEVLAFA